MRDFWRQNGKLLLVVVLALICGLFMGMAIGLAMQTEPADEARETSGTVFSSVLPTTQMTKSIRFASCGHILSTKIDARAFVGYTEAELAAFYTSSLIETFTVDRIVISTEHAGFCPNHYVLSTRDGVLCVYQTDSDTLTERIVQVLDHVDVAEFGEETRKDLADGIAFASTEEIDVWLENAES